MQLVLRFGLHQCFCNFALCSRSLLLCHLLYMNTHPCNLYRVLLRHAVCRPYMSSVAYNGSCGHNGPVTGFLHSCILATTCLTKHSFAYKLAGKPRCNGTECCYNGMHLYSVFPVMHGEKATTAISEKQRDRCCKQQMYLVHIFQMSGSWKQ